MCVVSAVMDQYSPHFPYPPVGPHPLTFPVPRPVPRPTPRVLPDRTNDELRELIESFRQAVKAAETFDRLTGQPDCVDPEKEKLLERVEELEQRLDRLEEHLRGV